jgi:hypothetical protein
MVARRPARKASVDGGTANGIIRPMSRVTYTDLPATAEQEARREAHQVALVSPDHEGNGVNNLPGGVYGFTYSPALQNAPLFATRRYRSYETHKIATGEVFIVGFATAADAGRLSAPGADVTIQIQPQPEEGCATLVKIPYSRIRHHRQYAAPNQHGFTVTITP